MKPMKKCQHLGLLLAGVALPVNAKAAGAGLPQLDISTWPSQLFWLVVLFTAGYIIMAKVVTPRIGKVLEERRTKLDDDLGKARTASEDAARIRAEYEADLDAARSLPQKQLSKPQLKRPNKPKQVTRKLQKSWLKKWQKPKSSWPQREAMPSRI